MSSSDRRPYETASDITQGVLDAAQDNLAQKLEMIAEITAPDASIIRVSDRAKYVGNYFYFPRVKFPVINRTLGDWLSEALEFSTLELTVNNTDKIYSNYLPAGEDFNGWIGRRLTVKVGLAEASASYKTIFSGTVTDTAGFRRDTASFTLVCRSDFDKVNTTFPQYVFNTDSYPDLEEDMIGKTIPVIYGDWTTKLRPEGASVPAFPVNGANADVKLGDERLWCVVSPYTMKFLDDTNVILNRGDKFYTFAKADIEIVDYNNGYEIITNAQIKITQKNLSVEGEPWIYAAGDKIFVQCKGINLTISGTDWTKNLVAQAKDIIKRFGGLTNSDFDSSWAYFMNKSSPEESNIKESFSRVWVQETKDTLAYALSMLEQLRLEAYVSRENLWTLSSLHFDEFEAAPSFAIKNWDVVKDSFVPQIDSQNNWNRAKADYGFDPSINENRYSTLIYKNQAAINQTGRAISKLVTFPNLYQKEDVIFSLKEMIKLASSYSEMIEIKLTSRAILKDLGDFVNLQVNIGSVDFSVGVPAMIRQLGYDPAGLSISAVLWSFQMCPFDGWNPGFAGIVGGYNATIESED